MKALGLFAVIVGMGFVASTAQAGCREGHREVFLENIDSSADFMAPVHYVCRNGRYVPYAGMGAAYRAEQNRAAKAGIRGCREGQTEIFHEYTDSSAEHTQPVWYVCRNGRFVGKFGPTYQERVSAAAKRSGRRGCVEGQREIFLEHVDSSAENLEPVHYVCRHGKFRRTSHLGMYTWN